MREKLTLSLLTMEFTRLLVNILLANRTELQFSLERQSFITGQKQQHADVAIIPEHLYKSLDDVSEDLLMPAANKLAEFLIADRAAYTFELNGPPVPDIECSIHRYEGCSVRGMAMREKEFPGEGGLPPITVDLFRFDVLYREASLQ